MLDEASGRIVSHVFPGGAGRWEIRRRSFREGGRPHELLVISDLSRALREEERQAWQRLVRVIGHELNNSLAPIKSMAGTLQRLIGRDRCRTTGARTRTRASRSSTTAPTSLGRFMGAYARLARLPRPRRRPWISRCRCVRRVARCTAEKIVENLVLQSRSEAMRTSSSRY
jgi:two-component system, NtrC family, nitrogen regulation sensor histidine kinase NtrY